MSEKEYFYYLKYIGCSWKNTDELFVKLNIEYNEEQSEDITLNLDLNSKQFSCSKKEKNPEIERILKDNDYLNIIRNKVEKWLDAQSNK